MVFEQRKHHVKRYGRYLVDRPENIKNLCFKHHSHLAEDEKWNEDEFIDNMGRRECIYCQHDLGTSCMWSSDHQGCKEFRFEKEKYYSINKIKENSQPPGGYGDIEWEVA